MSSMVDDDCGTISGSADERELLAILDRYMERLRAGEAVDIEAIIGDHPELEEQLRGCLDSLLLLQQLAAPDVPALPRDVQTLQAWTRGRLGEYQLIREIGRGGMGIVYEATQLPLGRRVAIKVLPFAAMLDQRQTTRFMLEAQVAAQLHHPHIVPVHSVGCEHGVHYYSMQYIEGQSLETAIGRLREFAKHHEAREQRMPGGPCEGRTLVGFSTACSHRGRDFIDAVARLGVQAADALQHAHDYGVVHRDIKPSNLLVDGDARLWITDFGLARCQAESSLTRTGAIAGTLQYMSPEQALGRTRWIDHRTDIYSLGVTLYELLTLRPAFDDRNRQRFLEQIEWREPLPPRRLNPAVPLDLQTILLKAISKRRGDRYATAREMAEDLQRFLRGSPIRARHPSVFDRTGKWMTRHRAVVLSALLVLAAALLGTTVATYLVMRQATAARDALAQSERHLLQAERNFRQARIVVEHFGLFAAERLAGMAGAEPLRRELLDDTLRYYRAFIQQAGNDPRLQADLAVTYFKSAELHERLGDRRQALAAYEEARTIYEMLAVAATGEGNPRDGVAMCCNNIALLRAGSGDVADADLAYQRAIELQETMLAQRSWDSSAQRNLALTLSNRGLFCGEAGRTDEADACFERALAIQEHLVQVRPDDATLRYDLAMTLNNISCRGSQDLAQSLTLSSRSAELLRALAASPGAEDRFVTDYALCLNNRASLLMRVGQVGRAETLFREAAGIYERFAEKAPAVSKHRLDLAVTCNNLACSLNRLEKYGDVEASLRKSCDILRRLVESYPDIVQYRGSLGGACNNLGLVCERTGQLAAARTLFREAVTHQELACRSTPDVRELRRFLGESYANLERTLVALGMVDEAAEVAVKHDRLEVSNASRESRPAGSPATAAPPSNAGL